MAARFYPAFVRLSESGFADLNAAAAAGSLTLFFFYWAVGPFPVREAGEIFSEKMTFLSETTFPPDPVKAAAAGSRHGGAPNRVLRGGSWNNNDSTNLLSSNRNNDTPTNRNDNNGFRVVLEVGSGGKVACGREA